MAIDPGREVAGLREMEFRKLADFNAGHAGVFWSEAGGPGPWEMHPDTDEFIQVLDGAVAIEMLPADGGPSQTVTVGSGEFCIVPRGCWHRQLMLERSRELYLTPGPTAHSTAVDPRAA